MFQKTVSMTFFTDRYVRNIFYNRVSVFSLNRLSFQFRFVVATHVLPICQHFLIKKCYSMHITHFSVNFTWFVLLSHKRSDGRLLFKLGTLWFSAILIASKLIFLHDKYNFCYQPIPNNAMFAFMGKDSEEKNLLSFFRVPVVYWMTLIDR